MNVYDLIVIFENYFLVKLLELYVPEIESNRFISVLMTIILTVESFVLRYIQIGEHLELLFPIITLLIYSLIYSRNSILSKILKVLAIFVNMTFLKIIVIMFSSIIIGSNFQNFYNDYLTMFILTSVSIMALGVEYLFLKNH